MFERIGQRLAGSVLIWDLLITLVCLYVSSKIRLWLEFGYDLGAQHVQIPWQLYVAVSIIWVIIFLLLTPQRALFSSNLIEAIGRLVAAVALSTLSFAGLLYLSFRDISRLQFIYFAVGNFISLLILHLIVRSYIRFRHRSGWQRRVLLVGDGLATQQLTYEFARRPWAGLQIVGCTSDNPITEDAAMVLGSIDITPQLITEYKIDEVIFAFPPQQQDRVAELSLQMHQYPVMLHMVPGALDLAFARTPVETLGGIPLVSLRESALSDAQRLFKRLFDTIASAFFACLVCAFPADDCPPYQAGIARSDLLYARADW